MHTYNKYIVKSILPPLIIIAGVLTSLVWITQIMRLLYMLDKGVSLIDFLSLVVLIIPSLLFSILPLITLLATIFVYNKLAEERQILVLRSSGLSDFAIAKPALFIAIFFTAINFFISAYLMPVSYNKLKIRLGVMRDSYISSIVEVRKFNQISKDTTLYIDGRDSDSNLYGVILFDNRKPETRSVIFARHGKFNLEDGEAYFQLQQGLRQAYDSNKHMTRLYFDDLTVTIEKEQLDVSNKKKNSLESFIGEMLYPDPNMHPDTQKRRIADGHLRIIWPFFNIVFTILGLSYFLKIRPSRNSQWSKIMHSFLPVLLAAIVHFTLQKFAYKNLDIIFLCYANVLLCIIIGFLQCRRAKM